jgi:hypothetical protein
MVPNSPRTQFGPGARVAVVALLVELVAVGEEEAEVLEDAVGEPGEVGALLGVVTMTLALMHTFHLKMKKKVSRCCCCCCRCCSCRLYLQNYSFSKKTLQHKHISWETAKLI